MKRLFATFTVLLGLWFLGLTLLADPPMGSMKYNRYTTNNTAQVDAYIASVAGSGTSGVASAVSSSITNQWKRDATNAAGGTLASVPVIVGSVTNADRYGMKHDGRTLIGNITSGSAVVTLTSGSVSSADVGSHVRVRFGTSYTQDAVGTISSTNSSSSFTLSKACGITTNGTDILIAKTDDADALQSAIDAIESQGGGTLLCEPGKYWIGHQINFHDVGESNSVVHSVNIVGANGVLANWTGGTPASWAVPDSATVFWSGEESGSGGDDAMFGGTGHIGRITFEKILFRLPTDPDMAGVDGRNFNSLIMRLPFVDTGGFNEYDPRLPMPSHTNAIALRYPKNGNSGGGTSRIEGGAIFGGFFHAITFGEHLTVSGLAIANCINGITPIDCFQAVFEYLDIEGCINAINGTNTTYASTIIVNAMHFENTLTGWWTSRTLVNDPNGVLYGRVFSDSSSDTTVTNNFAAGQEHIDFGPNLNTFNNPVQAGYVQLSRSTTVPRWPEIASLNTNKGLVIKPATTNLQSYDLIVAPRSDFTAEVLSLNVHFSTNYAEIGLKALIGSGAYLSGVPMRFYPLAYGSVGYALSVETNGNIVAGRGQFVGNGAGLTNISAGSATNAIANTNGTGYGTLLINPTTSGGIFTNVELLGTVNLSGAIRAWDGSLLATNMTARTNDPAGYALTTYGGILANGTVAATTLSGKPVLSGSSAAAAAGIDSSGNITTNSVPGGSGLGTNDVLALISSGNYGTNWTTSDGTTIVSNSQHIYFGWFNGAMLNTNAPDGWASTNTANHWAVGVTNGQITVWSNGVATVLGATPSYVDEAGSARTVGTSPETPAIQILAGTPSDYVQINDPYWLAGNGSGLTNLTLPSAATVSVMTVTNFQIITNATAPTVSGGISFWNSNGVLYGVSATKTNLISDLR